MSFKMFTISSMYPGYLGSFYSRFSDAGRLSYNDHYNLLLQDTTEFAGSYSRTFNRLGTVVKCAIANDSILQNKWNTEFCSGIANKKAILFEQVKSFQPEILNIEDLNFTDPAWLEEIREKVKSIKLIVAYHCSPFSPKIIERLKKVDFLITCTPGLKKEMENNGIRTHLVYHGFDTDLIKRIDENNNYPQNNLLFSGSLSAGADYHAERIRLVESLINEKVDIALYVNLEKQYKIRAKQSIYYINELFKKLRMEGFRDYVPLLQYGTKPVENYSHSLLKKSLPSVFGIDMYNLFRRSKIVLNKHIGVAGSYAGNMRLFEVTGVGSCLLTDNKSNLGDLFDIDKEIVVFDSTADCIEKAKWLLENDEKRKSIAIAGQKRTLESHTVENRCRLILEIIEKELNHTVN